MRSRHITIDFHGLNQIEAVGKLMSAYSCQYKRIILVHGYGSGGSGGALADCLRAVLNKLKAIGILSYSPGESMVDGNPGRTHVFPARPLPSHFPMKARERVH